MLTNRKVEEFSMNNVCLNADLMYSVFVFFVIICFFVSSLFSSLFMSFSVCLFVCLFDCSSSFSLQVLQCS